MENAMKANFFNRINKYKNTKMFEPYYQGISENKLMVQRCSYTDNYIWPPRITSPYSPTGEIIWEEVKGIGKVYTFNVVYRAFHPYFSDKVPYVIGIIELEEGIRMIGNILIDPEEVSIGMQVKVNFLNVDDLTLVQWEAI